MAHIRELLVSASLVNQGEMVSYVPVTTACENGMYCSIYLNTIKIQSRTAAGAIVLLCDYIFKNAIPRWRKQLFVDMYECMNEEIKNWEYNTTLKHGSVSDSEKLYYLIGYFFEEGSEIMLMKEKVRTVILS